MIACPCSCGRHVKPGNTYASPGCWMSTAEGRARISRGQRQQWGKEGGKARTALWRQAVLDRFRHLDRDAAILAAVEWSRVTTVRRQWRAKQASEAA